MPSDWLYIDTAFPSFTGEESVNEKISTIQNYLFMLVEQLRYTLHNLDLSNMNSTAVSAWAETITEPIYARIADDEGNLAQLALTAQGLAAQISDAEGNISALQLTASSLTTQIGNAQGDISTLQQTASSLTTQISNAQGDISTLQQTASSLTSRVSDAEGNISALQQTASSLTTQIGNAQGDISTLQQTASSLTTRIGNAEGSISTLQQTVDGFRLSVSNGSSSSVLSLYANNALLSSATIRITGMVTFTDLSTAGSTTIYGGNIDTDSLEVSDLYGQYVYLRNSSGTACGILSITGASSSSAAVALRSYGALRLTTDNGDVFMQSSEGGYVQLNDEVILGAGDTRPNQTNTWSCGTSAALWSDVYAYNGTIVTSDLTKKNSVVYGLEAYDSFFDRLKPISFLFNEGTSGRRHTGLGAQDVEQDLADSGLTTLDFAGLIKSPRKDAEGQEIEGEYDYALRYSEFVALLIEQVQKLKARISKLEEEIA